MVKYDEPQVDISMRGKDSLMILGQNNISDFSGTSEGGLTFRDYKDAFTNSCLIDIHSQNDIKYINDVNYVPGWRSGYISQEEFLRNQGVYLYF